MNWDVARIGTTSKVREYRIFTGKLLGGHLENPPSKQEFSDNRDRRVGSEDCKQTGLVFSRQEELVFISDIEFWVILINSFLC
jgi:hypothetical protein